MSWTPKNAVKGMYTGSVDWDCGPFGKVSASTKFEVGGVAKPRSFVPMSSVRLIPSVKK